FASRGLRVVNLRFDPGDGTAQNRLLYTLVRGPARLLVFGAASWAEGLNPARWTVIRAEPATPPDPGDFDAVLVDALSPADFQAGYAARLLAAADGTGLLIVNGGQRGDTTQPQLISDWG